MCGRRARMAGGVLLMAAMTLGGGASRALADAAMFEKTLPSLTWILCPNGEDKISTGSGVLIDARHGLVLTAYHVVAERPEVIVFFPARDADGELITDPKEYIKARRELGVEGTVIARDARKDLALIRLPQIPENAKAVAIATGSPRPGQGVYAIGNSGSRDGVLWRYIDGTVRQVYRTEMSLETKQDVNAWVVEMTLPTNKGDSGGPILNAQGELVAITSNRNPDEIAVHYGIDVREIRTMVGPTLARTEPSPSRPEPSPSIAARVESSPVVSRGPAPADDLPVARVTNLEIDHDVIRGGRRGLLARLDLDIDHAKGRPCLINLSICDADGRLLRTPLPASPEPVLPVGANSTVTPTVENWGISRMTLFIPYDSIEPAIPTAHGRVALKGVLNVYDMAAGRWIMNASAEKRFLYNRDLGGPARAIARTVR
jgi:Trypsin-like peptidase domain